MGESERMPLTSRWLAPQRSRRRIVLAIRYRAFRNPDPPALVRIWNESFAGRGAAFLQGTTPLEHHVLAKPYFDPAGLIVAVDENETPVGFIHAGFGPSEDRQKLAFNAGVICALAVRPSARGRGVGTELLHQAENYLHGKGAKSISFGGTEPRQPFYWGVYGGCEPLGVLASDACADPFLRKNGFEVALTQIVLQRSLDQPINVPDARFAGIRRRTEVKIAPRASTRTWYDECVIGPLEMLHFQVHEQASGNIVAEARVWDMDLFGWRWHQPAAGLIDLSVVESRRRQGLGKYIVLQVLKYLQEQFFTLVETHVPAMNSAALGLFHSVGFTDADEGRVYRLKE
jgi:ribosomal protein S18 acetylase RimI-like enzyme